MSQADHHHESSPLFPAHTNRPISYQEDNDRDDCDYPNRALIELLELPPTLVKKSGDAEIPLILKQEQPCSFLYLQYLMDVYQLLSMRPLVCWASYTSEGCTVEYTYTCQSSSSCPFCIRLRRPNTIRKAVMKKDEVVRQTDVVETGSACHTCQAEVDSSNVMTVLSAPLLFAVVARFMFEERHFTRSRLHEAYRRRNGKASEELRQHFNLKFGWNVAETQWKWILLLLRTRGFPCSDWDWLEHLNEQGQLSCWDLWLVASSDRFFGRYPATYYGCPIIRRTDQLSIRCLKWCWRLTVFPSILLFCGGAILGLVVLLFGLAALAVVWLALRGLWAFFLWLAVKSPVEEVQDDMDQVVIKGTICDRWEQIDHGKRFYMVKIVYQVDGLWWTSVFHEKSKGYYTSDKLVRLVRRDDGFWTGLPDAELDATGD